MNKCDLLQRKLKRGIQLKQYVPTYGDRPNDLQSVAKCECLVSYLLLVRPRQSLSISWSCCYSVYEVTIWCRVISDSSFRLPCRFPPAIPRDVTKAFARAEGVLFLPYFRRGTFVLFVLASDLIYSLYGLTFISSYFYVLTGRQIYCGHARHRTRGYPA